MCNYQGKMVILCVKNYHFALKITHKIILFIKICNYVWNSNLGNRLSRYAREVNPKTFIIFGGPESNTTSVNWNQARGLPYSNIIDLGFGGNTGCNTNCNSYNSDCVILFGSTSN